MRAEIKLADSGAVTSNVYRNVLNPRGGGTRRDHDDMINYPYCRDLVAGINQ